MENGCVSSLQAGNVACCRGLAMAFCKKCHVWICWVVFFFQGVCALFAFSGKLNWGWEVLVLQRLQVEMIRGVAGEEEDHLTVESGAAGYGKGLRRRLGRLHETRMVCTAVTSSMCLAVIISMMCCWPRNTFPAEIASQKRQRMCQLQ